MRGEPALVTGLGDIDRFAQRRDRALPLRAHGHELLARDELVGDLAERLENGALIGRSTRVARGLRRLPRVGRLAEGE
jgi:hypothetical protein